MKYDLHMHTVFSDGTDDVETIIEKVRNAGIDFFSITDHDTALSAKTILKSAKLKKKIHDLSLEYVTGVEWSCIFEDTKMHILAYDFDPFLPEIAFFEQEIKALLKQKELDRLKQLASAGYVLSEKSKEFLSTRENVRRLDIANCLVNDGYFENIQDSMTNFLNKQKFSAPYKLDAKKVIETLSKCGAKMVWAHSLHGIGEKPLPFEKIDEIVSKLVPFGLSGLECYYSLYNHDEIEKLKKIAQKYGLFVTIGSDYHGKNKTVDLGETSSDKTVPDLGKQNMNKIFSNVIF